MNLSLKKKILKKNKAYYKSNFLEFYDEGGENSGFVYFKKTTVHYLPREKN